MAHQTFYKKEPEQKPPSGPVRRDEVDVPPDQLRRRARRFTLAIIGIMLFFFGLALVLLFEEQKKEQAPISIQEQAARWAVQTNQPVFESGVAEQDSMKISFDPDPFIAQDDTPDVEPGQVTRAMGEIRVAHEYLKTREWDWAERHARNALDIWPNMEVALRLLGVVFTQRGQFDQAQIALESALKKNPFNAETYNNLASVYMHKGGMGKAEELLQTALEIKPEYAVARLNLGYLYLIVERMDLAIEQLEWVLESYPKDPAIRNNLAVAYLRVRRLEDARSLLLQVVEGWPESTAAYYNMAIAYVFEERFDEALEWIRKGAAMSSPLDFQNFMDDPDFDALRARPEYNRRLQDVFESISGLR